MYPAIGPSVRRSKARESGQRKDQTERGDDVQKIPKPASTVRKVPAVTVSCHGFTQMLLKLCQTLPRKKEFGEGVSPNDSDNVGSSTDVKPAGSEAPMQKSGD